MAVLNSILSAATVIAVAALIIFGMNACGERHAAVKTACIAAGGTVIEEANSTLHCITAGKQYRPEAR